jgi:hypothetical protein
LNILSRIFDQKCLIKIFNQKIFNQKIFNQKIFFHLNKEFQPKNSKIPGKTSSELFSRHVRGSAPGNFQMTSAEGFLVTVRPPILFFRHVRGSVQNCDIFSHISTLKSLKLLKHSKNNKKLYFQSYENLFKNLNSTQLNEMTVE